ncbi:aldo/keto reductase [Gynuella sunshinyii]|uniref:Putative oxidoreductase (Related to aryl-alcohol dehydrogenase) n=1 Tax=Gynuella sunshinyii YC6258 TaxID=1445510 RepID=A0A0C5VCY8_9GAMM|nr:aldo/keto reductase [Gynuella sunshinyii]AJQ92372.1 putative oxidoreductase (related to aryl-alcohol dehydrogenase) [Gynuella sunshinyii YC6258]
MVKQRLLGKTGFSISEIGLGCWQLGGDWGALNPGQAEDILSAAQQSGVTFWDTADVYGAGDSEEYIGRFNRQHPDPDRVIVTKAGRTAQLYPDHYQRDHLKAAIEQSRERLQVEALDLLQLHCIPFDEIKRGAVFEWLEEFQQEGLIKYYGASVETVEEALYCIHHSNVSTLQIIFNLFRQDPNQELLARAQEANVGIIVRLGLASGLLSGKMSANTKFPTEDHRNFNKDGEAFNVGETFSGLPFNKGVELAEELKRFLPENMTLAQMSLRWLLDHPAVSSVITGASRGEQIKANAEVSSLPPLDDDLHQKLAEFYQTQVRPYVRGSI